MSTARPWTLHYSWAFPTAAGALAGGWPKTGAFPAKYRLDEMDSAEYPVRTEQNVLDSDGTLILCRGKPTGGTELTLRLAERHRKPYMVVDLDHPLECRLVRHWLAEFTVATLNVAGPRQSQCPGIATQAADFLMRVLGE